MTMTRNYDAFAVGYRDGDQGRAAKAGARATYLAGYKRGAEARHRRLCRLCNDERRAKQAA